jgi:hypothetical protein
MTRWVSFIKLHGFDSQLAKGFALDIPYARG